jgi:hypothetical protein
MSGDCHFAKAGRELQRPEPFNELGYGLLSKIILYSILSIVQIATISYELKENSKKEDSSAHTTKGRSCF